MQEITYTEFEELRKSDPRVVLIDVRERIEHGAYSIGGINIPMSEINKRIHEIPLNVPVVLYCRSGARSLDVVHALSAHGWKNVVHLQDGLLGVPSTQYV